MTAVSIAHVIDARECEHSFLVPLRNEPAFIDEEQEGRLVQGLCSSCSRIVTVETKDGKRTGRSWLQIREVEA